MKKIYHYSYNNRVAINECTLMEKFDNTYARRIKAMHTMYFSVYGNDVTIYFSTNVRINYRDDDMRSESMIKKLYAISETIVQSSDALSRGECDMQLQMFRISIKPGDQYDVEVTRYRNTTGCDELFNNIAGMIRHFIYEFNDFSKDVPEQNLTTLLYDLDLDKIGIINTIDVTDSAIYRKHVVDIYRTTQNKMVIKVYHDVSTLFGSNMLSKLMRLCNMFKNHMPYYCYKKNTNIFGAIRAELLIDGSCLSIIPCVANNNELNHVEVSFFRNEKNTSLFIECVDNEYMGYLDFKLLDDIYKLIRADTL